MRRPSGAVASVIAICLGGVTACAAAPPAPVSAPPHPASSSASASAAPRASAAVTPSPSVRSGLGAELEIKSVDRTATAPMLEFASDGASIIFSSGRADDVNDEASPDLWAIDPASPTEPELLWRNPERANALVKIAADLGTVAFVDMPLTGERAWKLWVIPQRGAEAILLDTHPGDETVPSFVPSVAVYQPTVAWTAFDRGPSGPVSQLLVAEGPDWEPRVIAERPALEAELWFPSLYGYRLVYSEVRYSPDRTSDERSVHLLDIDVPGAQPRRLDTSGRATMPLIVDDTVVWKEADPGFNMVNWGKMFRYDLNTDALRPMSAWPQEYVNYPSAGSRFVAWWGADASKLGVYDLRRDLAREIEIHPGDAGRDILRPHLAGDLLVWLFVDGPGAQPQLRYAYLPQAGAERFED